MTYANGGRGAPVYRHGKECMAKHDIQTRMEAVEEMLKNIS